jgi:hypothetical protein
MVEIMEVTELGEKLGIIQAQAVVQAVLAAAVVQVVVVQAAVVVQAVWGLSIKERKTI